LNNIEKREGANLEPCRGRFSLPIWHRSGVGCIYSPQSLSD